MKYQELKAEIDLFNQTSRAYADEMKRPQCDKFGYGFNLDNRFSTMSINLSLDSWTGYYGSSSCSTAVCCSEEIFGKYLISYMQQNFDDIINGVCNLMEADLINYIDDEIDKLEIKLSELRQIKEESK